VPECLCDVSVTDEHGTRHTIRVMARSVNTAACYYFATSWSSPADRLPKVGDGTVYEVQPVGESVVYRVEHRRMLEWANRTAERQWAKSRTKPPATCSNQIHFLTGVIRTITTKRSLGKTVNTVVQRSRLALGCHKGAYGYWLPKAVNAFWHRPLSTDHSMR
jgi:hypothetical protein